MISHPTRPREAGFDVLNLAALRSPVIVDVTGWSTLWISRLRRNDGKGSNSAHATHATWAHNILLSNTGRSAGRRALPARCVSGGSSVPCATPTDRHRLRPTPPPRFERQVFSTFRVDHRSLILQTLSSDGEWMLSAWAGSWAGAAAGAVGGAGAAAGAPPMDCPLAPNPTRAIACSLCSWRSWRSCCSLFCKSRYALRLARFVSERRTDSSS